jgi:small subunit ribosomal protein S13e
MGRLHSNGKGISASAIPYSRSVPAWLKTTPEQVVDQICKLAKKGVTPSQIGVILRDSHGVAQVKIVTGMFGVLGISSRKKRLLTFLRLQVTRSSGSSRAMVWIERLLREY